MIGWFRKGKRPCVKVEVACVASVSLRFRRRERGTRFRDCETRSSVCLCSETKRKRLLRLLRRLKLRLHNYCRKRSSHFLPYEADLAKTTQRQCKASCKRTQHYWPTTPNIVGFYMFVCVQCLHTPLHVAGSFCVKFETGQTYSFVQTDAATRNIVGPTMLGVVASLCT